MEGVREGATHAHGGGTRPSQPRSWGSRRKQPAVRDTAVHRAGQRSNDADMYTYTQEGSQTHHLSDGYENRWNGVPATCVQAVSSGQTKQNIAGGTQSLPSRVKEAGSTSILRTECVPERPEGPARPQRTSSWATKQNQRSNNHEAAVAHRQHRAVLTDFEVARVTHPRLHGKAERFLQYAERF